MHHRILKSDLSPKACICDNYSACSSVLQACENCSFLRAVLKQYVTQQNIAADELSSDAFWNYRMERLHEYLTVTWHRLKKRYAGKRVFRDGVDSRTKTTLAVIEAIENGRAQALVELYYKDDEDDTEQFE